MELTDVLNELGIAYRRAGEHHHVSSGWLGIDCDICSPSSNRFKLGINLDWHNCNCWTCGRMRLADALAEASGRPPREVRALLSQVIRYFPQADNDCTPHRLLRIPDGVGPMLPQHRQYLAKRGLDPDAAARIWGVQGIGMAARLAWRLFIPIHRQGKMVSWTTRSLAEGGRRYLSAGPAEEAFPHKRLLFGQDLARHAIIVVEGPLDCLAIGPGAVATLGVGFTTAQVAQIGSFPVRAVAFDNEPEAQRRARDLCRQIAFFPGNTHCVTLRAKDPGSASRQEILELRRRFLECS